MGIIKDLHGAVFAALCKASKIAKLGRTGATVYLRGFLYWNCGGTHAVKKVFTYISQFQGDKVSQPESFSILILFLTQLLCCGGPLLPGDA